MVLTMRAEVFPVRECAQGRGGLSLWGSAGRVSAPLKCAEIFFRYEKFGRKSKKIGDAREARKLAPQGFDSRLATPDPAFFHSFLSPWMANVIRPADRELMQ